MPFSDSELDSAVGRRYPWGDILLLAVFAVIVSTIYFTGLYSSDDIAYVKIAQYVAGLTENPHSPLYFRTAMIIPYAGYLKIFSDSPLTLTATFFSTVFIILILAIYHVTYRWAGRYYAVIASVLALSNPVLYRFSGALLPDIIIALLVLGVVYFSGKYLMMSSVELATLSKQKLLPLAIAGLLITLVYTLKEILLILFIPVWIIAVAKMVKIPSRQNIKIATILILGMLIGFLFDIMVQQYYYGSPFARIEAILSHDDIIDVSREIMVRQGDTLPKRWATGVSIIRSEWQWYEIYWYIAIIGVVAHLLLKGKKNTQYVALTVSAAWVFIFHVFGSLRLDEYVGIPIQQRYFAPMIPLLMISVAMTIKYANDKLIEKYIGEYTVAIKVLMLCVVLMVAAAQIEENLTNAGVIYRSTQYKNFNTSLGIAKERYPKLRVVASDYFSHRVLIYGEHPEVISEITNEQINSLLSKGFIYLTMNPPDSEDRALDYINNLGNHNYSIRNISSELDIRPWKTRWDEMLSVVGRRDLARKGKPIMYAYLVDSTP